MTFPVIRRVLGRQIGFTRVSRCEVLQFGGTSLSGLQPLTSDFIVGLMPTVGEFVNLRILIIAILKARLTRWGYYRTYLEKSGARLIVVWYDTMLEAYEASQRLNVPVYCVQNGVRHNVSPATGTGFADSLTASSLRPHATKYFVFSDQSEAFLSPLIETQFVQIGSFRLNEFASRLRPSARSLGPSPQVGFIVSFPNGAEVPGGSVRNNTSPFVRVDQHVISYMEYFSAEALVIQSLQVKTSELGWGLKIIGKRNQADNIEREFFSSLPGCESVETISHEKGLGYEVADQFDFLLTVDSTLGYEMLALGHRVGFIANRFRVMGLESNEMTFGYPLDLPADGPFWTSATDQEGILVFLDRFFKTTHDDWKRNCSILVSRLMRVDPNNQELRSQILEAIGQRQ